MRRVARWSLAFWALIACGLFAQEPTPAPLIVPEEAPPSPSPAPSPSPSPSPSAAPERFLIEKVTVTGSERESVRRVVATNTRLEAGREYTEADIRQAVHRVKHLPFVLDARPTLRRGTIRGAYELVLEIEESAHMHVGADGVYENKDPIFPSEDRTWGELTVGADRFLGARTQLVASAGVLGFNGLDQRIGLASLGLRRYDLAAHGTVLQLDANFWHFPTGETFALHGAFVLPIRRTQSLRLGADAYRISLRSEAQPPPPGYSNHTTALSTTLAWVYDTTDDPFAARAGLRLRAQSTYTSRRIDASASGEDAFHYKDDYWDHVLNVAYYLPFHRHLSFFAVASNCDTDIGESECRGTPGVGLRWVQIGRHNRYRAFVDAGALIGVSESHIEGEHVTATWSAAAGVRAPWGALRFDFSWETR